MDTLLKLFGSSAVAGVAAVGLAFAPAMNAAPSSGPVPAQMRRDVAFTTPHPPSTGYIPPQADYPAPASTTGFDENADRLRLIDKDLKQEVDRAHANERKVDELKRILEGGGHGSGATQ